MQQKQTVVAIYGVITVPGVLLVMYDIFCIMWIIKIITMRSVVVHSKYYDLLNVNIKETFIENKNY